MFLFKKIKQLEIEGQLEKVITFSRDGNPGSYKNAMLYILYLATIKIVGRFHCKGNKLS